MTKYIHYTVVNSSNKSLISYMYYIHHIVSKKLKAHIYITNTKPIFILSCSYLEFFYSITLVNDIVKPFTSSKTLNFNYKTLKTKI